MLLDGSGSLHELYGARAETLYLIRPDGYVGFRGQPAEVEPMIEYLSQWYLLDGKPPIGDATQPMDGGERENLERIREAAGA